MKTLFALVALCMVSMSLAFRIYDTHVEDPVGGDENLAVQCRPVKSIKLNSKVYQCTNDMPCDCPRLLCKGKKSCIKPDQVKCELTQDYEKIDLQKAMREFFGRGDCKCSA